MDVKLKELFAQTMGVPSASIDEATSPDTIGTWDSTNHMRLILAIEEEFGIEFDENEIIEIVTYGRIVDAVRKHTA